MDLCRQLTTPMTCTVQVVRYFILLAIDRQAESLFEFKLFLRSMASILVKDRLGSIFGFDVLQQSGSHTW